MKIRVELQAYLLQYSPDDVSTFDYELPYGATTGDLIRKLHIPNDLASVIIVSDANVDMSHALQDGDRVTIVPPLAGGSVASSWSGRKVLHLVGNVLRLLVLAAILFAGIPLLLSVASALIVGLGLVDIDPGGRSSIDQQPVSLDEARQLIWEGKVSRLYIRGSHGSDDGWCYFLLSDADDTPCQWKVDGVDVHLWEYQNMPTGVPILSEDDPHSVGLTSDQLNELVASVGAFNNTAPTPIALFDQR